MRRSKRPFGLYKQPGSRFWWCRIDGVRQSTEKVDYNEAVQEAARRAGGDDTGRVPANEATLERAITRFLEAKRAQGRAAGTFDMYRKKIGHLVRIIGQETDVNDVDSEAVDGYINQRRDEGAKANTIHKEIVTLRGILRQAKRDRKLRADLDEVMPISFDTEYTPRSRFLSPEHLDRILRELEPNHAAATAFMVAAACRLSDVFRAEPSDLVASPGFIRVRASKTKRNREGVRLVPITSLNEHLVAQIRAATADRKRLLFKPWSNVQRDLANAAARASACDEHRHMREKRRDDHCAACSRISIVPAVTPNDLRRTHATWLRANGVEPNVIGEVLGHVDGRMVERVYGRMTPESLAAVLNDRLSAGRLSTRRRSNG